MAKCLVALGSNLGDRASTLDAAVAELRAAAGVSDVRPSAWQLTLPVGGSSRREFLNGAAVVETSREPAELLRLLNEIEASHGRDRHERWGDRTLDLDLLLYDDLVIDMPELVVPHPRMSFRRFVLEPAVEISGEWVHPAIGWTLQELLDHLDGGADCVTIVSTIVSTDDAVRHDMVDALSRRYSATLIEPPFDDPKWPVAQTSWLSISPGAPVNRKRLPKLSILLGANAALVRQPGRGPTLSLATASAAVIAEEVFAAVAAVWPHLGSTGSKRLE